MEMRRQKSLIFLVLSILTIKMAPVFHALKKEPQVFDKYFCHAGQHDDLAEEVYNFFDVNIDFRV